MRHIDSLLTINSEQLYIRFIENHIEQPTIVFLHDSLGCVALWRDFPYQLAAAARCNLLLYDRRGYGLSEPLLTTQRMNNYLEEEADKLKEVLLHFNLTSAILFGHSDGGSIALIAAAKYPFLIKAVIAEAAHIFVEQETLDGIQAAIASYRDTNLKERLAKYHSDKTPAVFHAWTDTWLGEGYRSWNIEHFLPSIICPVLVIQGEADEYGTLKQVEGIANQVKGPVRTFILPEVGHSPHKKAPEAILEKAFQFILHIK